MAQMNDTNFKLSSQLLADLVDNVIIPTMKDKRLESLFARKETDGNDDGLIRRAIIHLGAALMMPSQERAAHMAERSAKEALQSGFNHADTLKIVEIFFGYALPFFEKIGSRAHVRSRYDAIEAIWRDITGIEHVAQNQAAWGEEEFLDFDDSQNRDDAIDDMHFTEEEIVDAATFMAENPIDEDVIDDLGESLKELGEQIDLSVYLSEEYWQAYQAMIERAVSLFSFYPEFRNLRIALEHLYDFMNEFACQDYESERAKMLKTLLDAIFEDLNKWYDEVLIRQSARDIHYLDAALMANIDQIKLMFASDPSGTKNSDGEMELF